MFKEGQRVIANCPQYPEWHNIEGVVIEDTGLYSTRVLFDRTPAGYGVEDGPYRSNFNTRYLRLSGLTTEEIISDYVID